MAPPRRVIIEENLFQLLWPDVDIPLWKYLKGHYNIFAGSVRGARSDNQDRMVIANIKTSTTSVWVAAVADGMGGMVDGAEAASIACSGFVAALATASSSGVKNAAVEAIRYANSRVFGRFRGKGGTTFSAIIMNKFGTVALNVGDSRTYSIVKHALTKITKDDTIAAQISEDTEDSIWSDPSSADNRLLQYIGMGDYLMPHLHILTPEQQNGAALLTTDGAHYIGNKMIQKVISNSTDKDVVRRITSIASWLSGHDNATVVFIPNIKQFVTNGALPIGSLEVDIATFEGSTHLVFDNTTAGESSTVPLLPPAEIGKKKRHFNKRRSEPQKKEAKSNDQSIEKEKDKRTEDEPLKLEFFKEEVVNGEK